MRAILLASLILAQSVSVDRATASPQAGNQPPVAPEFGLKNLNGRIVKLSEYKGKVVLINLWATWCAPCLVEMPELVRLQREHEPRGLQIIGVTYPDESRTSVLRLARKFKLNYPVLFGTGDLLDDYQIGEVLPATIVVDRDGNIRDRILGILDSQDFVEKIEPLLGAPVRHSQVRSIDTPAAPGSGEPNLYTASDGRVFLTWIEPADPKGHRLRFAIRNKDVWSEPRTIAEGTNWFVNWADFPSIIVLKNGTLVAHWLVKSGTDGHAYDVNISSSIDGGKTWSKPSAPHRDGTKTEHGFVSMLPWTGGRASAVWLDGRNFKEMSKDGHGPSTNEMTLRFAAIDATGGLSEETVLDSRVCECCQTSAATTTDGAIVVYRDRSPNETRDISLVRFLGGRWTTPRSLSADGWEIHGCPVNGPSVSADGRRVAVAWFTAPKEASQVKLIFSGDAGGTFGQPIRVDDGAPTGRVEVLMLPDGSALVSWLERTTSGADIRFRRVRPDGSRDGAVTVAASGVARASGFPQMTRAGNEIFFAWTDPGAPSRVRTAVTRIEIGK